MKFPKNRANLYEVVREDGALCGAWSNYDDAEDFRAACEQEFFEKTGHKVPFYVKLTTFYG
jgi:hypothetical protein